MFQVVISVIVVTVSALLAAAGMSYINSGAYQDAGRAQLIASDVSRVRSVVQEARSQGGRYPIASELQAKLTGDQARSYAGLGDNWRIVDEAGGLAVCMQISGSTNTISALADRAIREAGPVYRIGGAPFANPYSSSDGEGNEFDAAPAAGSSTLR